MKFKVYVEEKLSKVIEIEASTEKEAFDLAQEMYFNEEIVLCSDDYDNEVIFQTVDDQLVL